MLKYIDVYTNDDYDTVIRFLLKHNVPIKERDKVKGVIAADLPADLEKELKDLKLEESFLIGATPL